MITVLSGGTGGPKLIQGLKKLIKEEDLTIIVNTVENFYYRGLYIAPDVDTVLYTLADIVNEKTWYGRRDDTFITHEYLKKLGCPELLKIGDKDRAFKIQKTILKEKYDLSKAVDIQRKILGIKAQVLPMSNQESNIKIITDEGEMKFHEFLIEKNAKPNVLDVSYKNVKPAPKVIESIENSDIVVIGPSNPVTSIGPIISMKGVKKALKKVYVAAVSPFLGNKPFSGPAAKFMKAIGYEPTSYGVCLMYKDFLDRFVLDNKDIHLKKVEKIIKDVKTTNILMRNIKDKVRVAKVVLGGIYDTDDFDTDR